MKDRAASLSASARDDALRRAAADAIARASMSANARASARWLGRAMRLLPCDPTIALLHARATAAVDPKRGLAAAELIRRRFPAWPPAYLLHAHELLAAGDSPAATAALADGLARVIAPPDADATEITPPASDPTAVAAAAWAAGHRAAAVILVTHADGGGIERHIRARARTLAERDVRPIIVRPTHHDDGRPAWAVSDPSHTAQLIFPAPEGLGPLVEQLAADHPTAVEFHHAASHDAAIENLPARLGIPYDVFVHDYAPVCPRVTLCGGTGKYCGEPADARDCQDCLADHGARLPDATDIKAWRDRGRALLAGARHVLAPSADAARRVARHFPAIEPRVTPWDDDADAANAAPAHPRRRAGQLHVAVAGALTRDKGFDILLACARDADRRALPLRFTLIGHSIGDERLLATGRVFVTGPFEEGEAPSLLAETDADIGFLPAVWPETWSYALSDLWRASLWVVAFDLGAPAERIRAAGGGTLLPPGLPAPRLNDALLTLPFTGHAAEPRSAEPRSAEIVRLHARA